MIVQDYKNAAGSRLSLEIFEMDSPESAYGIYTFKRSGRGEPIRLGDECQLADYYLNLCKGPYLVTITGLDLKADAKEALLLLARAVEPKIGPSTAPPGLVSCLPIEGLESRSVKYFKGPLALYNSYPFFRSDVFGFSAGVKGDYQRGWSLYVFEYGDGTAARTRFAESGQGFEKSEKYVDFSKSPGIFRMKDDRGNQIYATMRGRYIMLLVGREDEAGAQKTFLLVGEKLPKS